MGSCIAKMYLDFRNCRKIGLKVANALKIIDRDWIGEREAVFNILTDADSRRLMLDEASRG